jgi:heme exporter protein A
MAAVETEELGRRYGRRWALAGVSLTLPHGSVTMLAGPNGAGKSTLLRVLATAIRPDHGTALVAGHDVRLARQEVRRRVALLDHHGYHYEALTARENLEVAAHLMGRTDDARVEALLARVGLQGRADDPASTFSAGMRKRLALARVLLQDAAVVLLDEPYGELDPSGFRLLDGIIGEMRESGTTVLMATHLVERGASLCDHAIVLVGGQVAWSGPAAAVPVDVGNGSIAR